MDLGTAEVKNIFGNIVKNLEINQYSNSDPVINNVKDPTLRAILKYKDHLSILGMKKLLLKKQIWQILKKKFIT